MKNLNLRFVLSAVCIASVFAAFTKVDAAPVRFDQVVQVINAKPGQAATGGFAQLRIVGDTIDFTVGDDDGDDKKKTAAPQDDRVITETKTEIVEDEVCDCVEPERERRGFPKWALLGLAAIPIAFILIRRKKETPTPTRTVPTTETPTPPTTVTPTPTATKTPPTTVTPTPPEPVPEPMTVLLFGTGLAGIGLAARRRFGKKQKKSENEDES